MCKMTAILWGLNELCLNTAYKHYVSRPRDKSGYGLSQWEMTSHCNIVSHWLSPSPEYETSFIGWAHIQNDPCSPLVPIQSWSISILKVSRTLPPDLLYMPDRGCGGRECLAPFIPGMASSGFPYFSRTVLWGWKYRGIYLRLSTRLQ